MFANSGLSVGVTSNHVAADGRSMNHFMKFWTSIHKSPQGEDLTSMSRAASYQAQEPNKGHNYAKLLEDSRDFSTIPALVKLLEVSSNPTLSTPSLICLSAARVCCANSKPVTSSSLPLPYCSKDIIKDSDGISSIFLKDLQSIEEYSGPTGEVPDDDVLITLVSKRAKIEKLKHCVKSQNYSKQANIHISSFTVTCAFMWVNLMKLHEKINGTLDDDVGFHFFVAVDCRERFLSKIPANYFGNCLTYILVPAKRRELLMGESGIVYAAKAIGRKINELDNIGALKGVENWIPNITEAFKRGPVVVVASSPKFQVYNTDFGWGKPKKFDMVHIAAHTCFSLSESRDEDGGLDIGIIVGRDKIDIFNAIFEQQLNKC
ncbi:hypothetical protein Ddye_018462 [Dipteronia dyeriana]|uniref:Uncharacterized protein n=1 Tax=Dipteronia dyeriana TaxID=168575 RepID=A0AAD9X1S6_9ROSI|nr:hypothetical protein Ddye_018462 [Dipteronia dyeriana]